MRLNSANRYPLFIDRCVMTLANKTSLEPASPVRIAANNSAALESLELLKGQKSVTIHHNGSLYRLQATKLGKLILTK